MLTKLPTSLNERNVGVVHEEWDGPQKEIGSGLEIGVEHGNVLAISDVAMLHPFFESACFVPVPVAPRLVFYVLPLVEPFCALSFYEFLGVLVHSVLIRWATHKNLKRTNVINSAKPIKYL